MWDNDIVRDILQRVVEAARRHGDFNEQMARKIEDEVKQDWGGSEPYISTGIESRRIERNEKIVSVWDAGNHDVKILARRFGLSEKQIRRIVGR